MRAHWIKAKDDIWLNLDHASMGYVYEDTENKVFEVRFHFPQQNGHFIVESYEERSSAEKYLDECMYNMREYKQSKCLSE